MTDNIELVRQLWAAFERGGIEAVLAIADPDVEWEPYGGGGAVYRGHDGLRAYMRARSDRDEQTDARLYSAFSKGNFVVGRGEVRISGPAGAVTMEPGWLYEFRNGKLVRFRGFPTQDDALRAAGLAPQDAAATVRRMWAAVNSQDVEGFVATTSHDVEWRPYAGRRDAYSGPEAAREFYFDEYDQAQSISVEEYAFGDFGEVIAFSGSLHMVDRRGAVTQRQIHYVFWVRDGKIARAQSFPRREQALAAAERAAAGFTPG